MSLLSADTVLVHAPHTAFVFESDISDSESSVVFAAHLLTSEIARFEGSGSLIWEIASQPCRVKDIIAEVAEIFEESVETVHDGVESFLEDLLGQDLIVKVPETAEE